MMPRFQASFSTWFMVLSVCAAVVFLSGYGFADSGLKVNPEALNALMNTLDGPDAPEMPMVYQDEDGFVRFLGAPPRARFLPPAVGGKSPANAESVAKNFVSQHAGAFGLNLTEMELKTRSTIEQQENTFIRLDQYFSGLSVFGAQVIVHVDAARTIQNVNADIMRDTQTIEKSHDFLTPVLTAQQAIEQAIAQNAAMAAIDLDAYEAKEAPELLIFEPGVFSMPGDTALAWKVQLQAKVLSDPNMVVLINAHTGDMVLRYATKHMARVREIYDAESSWDLEFAPLLRKEGQPPTGDVTADDMYDILGDCYDWYMNQHGRDSYDNKGSILRGYINVPFFNASWSLEANIMMIGTGLFADDVIAHEYTHGVTAADTDLIYFSYAGAITEMYSDQAGEFIDLTNGRGNDSPAVRWVIGEDIEVDFPNPCNTGPNPLPGIRYMKDPTAFCDPDRLSSPFLADPFSLFDYGGVHINSGVGNKLVYLLTDGDNFNGRSVQGMGIPKVADLFYAARPMLSRSANYYDFYYALRAASVMLGFSGEERMNVVAGARAVEIEPPVTSNTDLQLLRDFRAIPTQDFSGKSVVGLTWKNPNLTMASVPPIQITLYRSVADFPTGAADGLLLPTANTDTSYLDQDVVDGLIYYYTLIADIGTAKFSLYAKARAGAPGMPVWTEVFGPDLYTGANDFDLSYSQITFRPVLPLPPAADEPYVSATDFDDYEVTLTKNVYELPVKRNDGGSGAWTMTYTDDGWIPFNFGSRAFNFFGVKYDSMFVSSNGNLLFADNEALAWLGEDVFNLLNSPNLASHFALPRLSFLFADLAPHISGQVWGKDMDDRFVITLENVAVKPAPNTTVLNPKRVTVQVELFDSGHIRLTYLDAAIPSGIVGLSDGRGVPVEPAEIYQTIREGYYWADFSALPSFPSRMSINPIAAQIVDAGEEILFASSVELPRNTAGPPLFYASWDGIGPVPFTDNNDGTGRFYWQTSYDDIGVYTVRVVAELGPERVFQDVRLVVGRLYDVKPTAINLQLSAHSDFEDPTISRPIPEGTPLIASFEYYHPYQAQTPLLYGEGSTTVYWYRNGQVVPAFTNLLTIPPNITRADDIWWFQVIAETLAGIKGDPVASPRVSVLGVPRLDEVTPKEGLTTGGDRITIRGSRLSYPLAVTFGGVPGADIRVINDNELSVLTPVHAAGVVTVAVETPGGIGRRVDVFTYRGDGKEPTEDKVRNLFGCGPRESTPVSALYDLLPAALAVVLLLVYSRSGKKRLN